MPPPAMLGTYATPAFEYGSAVFCELRGEVVLVGLSAAPIPWPIGKRGRHKGLVLFGALVEAVRRESAAAVCHWWGVGPHTVWRWRKALGVGATTEGTSAVRREQALTNPGIIVGRQRAQEQSRDPDADEGRRAKIAQAHKGKPRRPEDVAPAHQANQGRSPTAETPRKMSAAHKRRGTRPPKAGPRRTG